MHTLDYSKGDDLTKCAAGVLPLEKTHIFYTEVECVGGGAKLLFFPDPN
jgi:hypothetical protein